MFKNKIIFHRGIVFLILLLTVRVSAQTTLANFNFESSNLSASAGAIGSPTLTGSAAVTYNGGSTTSSVASACFATANSKYFELTIATSGYGSITVDWNGRTSSTTSSWIVTANDGSGYGATLYTQTLGTSFTSAPTLSLGASFNNNSSIKVRWTASVSGTQTIRIDDIVIKGTSISAPTLTVSPSSLTGFAYNLGSGPSTSQSYNLSGTNLTGAPGSITVTSTTDYEVSSDNITFGATANVSYASATLSATPVYVRLKAGLAAGNYNGESISSAGGGATTQNVSCSGTVTAPTIILSTSTSSGFTYVVSNGPSANQTFTCSGSNLTSNITLTAPTDYEISLSAGAGFGSSLTLSPASGTVAATTIYARLKSGLSVATYNSEVITASSTSATNQTVTCSGSVTASAASDVVAVAGSEASSVSSTVNTNGPLTSTQGTQVWQFTIRDGGGSADADNLPTIVNAMTLANLNSAGLDWSTAINSIDIFDGTTNIGSLQNGSGNLTSSQAVFTSLNIIVPDNGSKTITVRLSVMCPLGTGNTEGDYFRFSISNTNITFASSTTSSQKLSGFVAAQSTSTVTFNDLDVVATQLVFTQQPTSTGNNTPMSPSVVVKATDACGNTDLGFSSVITITSTGTLTGSPVSSTASSGVATFSGLTHTAIGTNFTLSANSGGLSVVSSLFDIFTVTTFGTGDIAILGMCVNMSGCSGVAGEDEISFVSFEDITPGTTIDLTDNGFERKNCGSNTWGNTEGVIRITRTSSTIPKGTVVTLRVLDQTIFTPLQPDANWTVSYPNSGYGTFNMNSGDEQIYIMQGGVWNKGTSNAHDATYVGGTLMFGINTATAWSCNDNSTQKGDLPLALRCFSILPGIAADNIKYTGPVTPASQKDWIDRLNNSTNWTGSNTCAAYVGMGLNYANPQTYSIIVGGFNSGYWTGASNTDWYDCNNWQNYKVPDSLANVVIDNVSNDPVIGASPALYPNGAICNDLSITNAAGAGVLTMNNALSYFSIKGNISNNGFISATNGTTDLRSSTLQTISGTGTSTFYNLRLNNFSGVSLSQDITTSHLFTFLNGKLSTGSNKLILTNTSVPSITGYTNSMFINGTVRQYIASNTSVYPFPLGDGTTSANYKRADVVNNNLTGISYIDGFVNTITESTPNDDGTFAGVGRTENGYLLSAVMENAQWDLTPDNMTFTGDYGVRLYVANTGLSSGYDDSFCPVKRPSSSVTYADWDNYDPTTTIPAPGMAGRIYNSGNGYAERLGYTSFSKHAIAISSSPLPIELLNFNATLNETGSVNVYWSTSSETNNDYFNVERSIDAVHFTSIATVDGAGSSTIVHNYSTVDPMPLAGTDYYRLKQTDFNGNYSYSQMVPVTINKGIQENIYPNPVADILHIQFGSEPEQVKFEIIDLRGIVVLQKNQLNKQGEFNIDMKTLPAGTYILKTISGTVTQQHLIIKQ